MTNDFIIDIERKNGLKFNEDQRNAIYHFKGPALTLAVPGSGKTTLLLARTINLIYTHGVDPDKILTITFSKASARDMEYRYNKQFKKFYNYNIKFSTIHSFAYSIYRAYCKKKNIKFKLLEDGSGEISKLKLFRDIFLNVNKTYPTEDKLEEISNAISYIKNMMIPPEDIENEMQGIKNISSIYGKYEAFKKKNGLIDFDDMLTNTYEILRTHKEALKYYQNKYPFIQVDETQDTSKIQHKLIELMAGQSKNVFMVADDDQSIYGFRGAYPDFLLNFDATYNDSNIYYLKTNYRSDIDIIDICNHTIKNNTIRYPKVISPNSKSKGRVRIMDFETTGERNDFIIEEIKNCEGTVGILYRNNLSGITLANALDSSGVEFLLRDNKLSLFNHWVTSDIKSMLSLALVPQDISEFERICYKINGYISKKQLEYTKKNHMGRNVFDTLLDFPENNKRQISNITKIKTTFSELIRRSPYDSIMMIEEELGYIQHLNDKSELMGYSLPGLMTIISTLKEIASETDSIIEFFDRLDYLENLLKNSSTNFGAKVRLSTIHSSKGLEYDNVYIVDVEDQVFPSPSSVNKLNEGDVTQIEEERRLFYVGLSRAKENLNIMNIKFKNGTYVKPSVFIREISNHKGVENIKVKPTSVSAGAYEIGSKVTHKVFGVGEIISSNESITKILFDSGIKELSTPLCKEKSLLY